MSCSLMRSSRWLACLTMVVLSGCDAIKSIGQEADDSEEVLETSTPSVPPEVGEPIEGQVVDNGPPPVESPLPAPPTAEEVLAAFLAKPSSERGDDDLAQLAQTPALLAGITDLDLSFGATSNQGLHFLALFSDLQRINLAGTRVTNDGLSQLAACTTLTAISLDNLRFVDEIGVKELTTLPLEEISLRNTSVTEPVFDLLAEFENLQVLNLDGNATLTGIHFRGLIEKFGKLREFTASNTQIGFGLQKIGELNDLEVLHVGHAEVSDEVLQQLAQCRKLVSLDLSHNPITLLGIPFLARLNDLKQLNLSDCNGITDEALNNLGRLQELERLDISGTQCTLSGAQALKERLPDTLIVLDDQEL